jgi:hypothetical protein
MLKQRAQTTKANKSSPTHMQTPPERVPTLGTNQSGRITKLVRVVPPKPVRPVPKTGQADFVQQTTPHKIQKCKRNAQALMSTNLGLA